MANELDKGMIRDSAIVEEDELSSKGIVGTAYSTVSIVSVVTGTKTVTITGDLAEPRVQNKDLLVITGGLAAGNYSVNEVISETIFTVNEVIPNASSGSIDFFYRSGAEVTGIDYSTTKFDPSTGTIQEALNQIKKSSIKGHALPHVLVNDDLDLPVDNTTILASPSFDGCLNIDGEGYII